MLDPQGRIQITSDYRQRTGLVKDVLIIGMQKMFEVWDVDRWAHFDREARGGNTLDDTRVRLAEKGV